MYCSNIWEIAFSEKFKAFQCSYLRQIFKLPSYTPHWLLFLESMCRDIAYFLKMSESKSCMKLNWFTDLKTLLDKYELTDLLYNDSITPTPEHLLNLKHTIWKHLDDITSKLQYNTAVKMFRTHCNIDSAMNSNVCWNYIMLSVQIKSGIPRITFKGITVTLNAMNSYFNSFSVDDADMCNLCSMSVLETVFHLLFE
jgi:hypothetical protein